MEMVPGFSNRQMLGRHYSFARGKDPSVLVLDLDQAQAGPPGKEKL
jgi:hypothetical protein